LLVLKGFYATLIFANWTPWPRTSNDAPTIYASWSQPHW